MSIDELLAVVPPAARWHPEPLEDPGNALSYWQQAADALVPPDDPRLCEELVEVDPTTGRLAEFPTGTEAAPLLDFLADNRRTIELLRAGVACGRVRFPEPDEGEDAFEDVDSLSLLGDLGNTWFILARRMIADGDDRAAAAELVGCGQMAQMLCCGEGLAVHYLVGRFMTSTVTAGMRLLAARGIAEDTRTELIATLDRWLDDPNAAATCVRVELCSYALAELDRLSETAPLDESVDTLIDRHWAGDDFPDDGRLAWLHERILFLLEAHPAVLDKMATARLLGSQSADRIKSLRSVCLVDLPGHWRRLSRAQRRRRLESRFELWPLPLRPTFPYELLGPGETARDAREQVQAHLPKNQWASMEPPSDGDLAAARHRLRRVSNPLGILLAEALLSTNVTIHEHHRRRELETTRASLADPA